MFLTRCAANLTDAMYAVDVFSRTESPFCAILEAMTQTSVDRRAARTIGKLQRAHLALIMEHGYDRTSVEDICGAAGVSRSAFYAHYRGKDDLKRSGLDRLKQDLLKRQRLAAANGEAFSFSLPLFAHARDHLDLYRALSGSRGGFVALGAIRAIVRALISSEVATIAPALAGSERKATIEFLAGAYVALLVWWLDEGAQMAPGEIDARFRRLALAGLAPPHSA